MLLLVAGVSVVAAWVTFAPADLGGGGRVGVVAGKSMEPALRSGDLIVVRPGAYAVGEVVAYRSGSRLVVHRVVATDGGRLVLQGDANDDFDAVRPRPDQVLGEVRLRVPRAGIVFGRLHEHRAAVVIAAVLLAAAWFGRGAARRGVDWLRCHASASRPAPPARSTSETR
jgi:signal peptidase I